MAKKSNPCKVITNSNIRAKEKSLFKKYPNESPIRGKSMGRTAKNIFEYFWE